MVKQLEVWIPDGRGDTDYEDTLEVENMICPIRHAHDPEDTYGVKCGGKIINENGKLVCDDCRARYYEVENG